MSDGTPGSEGVGASASPPTSVLQSWGVDEVVPLLGGQGEAFRSSDLVFKPAPAPRRTAWLAGALDSLVPSAAVRIARPARSSTGTWVVDGWSAWQWLDGEPWTPTVPELLEVSERFHAAVAQIPWRAAMAGSDRWAVADRVAWGETDHELTGSLQTLADSRQPVPLTSQLVHGDLAGNVLTHPDLPPAVIDISPFWRPAAYADAIVVVDRAAYGLDCSVPDPDLLGPFSRQLLIRAVLFRSLSEPEPTDAYDPLIERLLDQG